jgi:heat shock protein HslJ
LICIIFVAKITIIWNNIMKRTILFSLGFLFSLILAVSCCDCRKRSKLEKPLVGTSWQLVQIMGKEVAAEGDSYTILFHNNGTATGAGDCNRFTATYTVTPSRALTIDNLGSTRRYCENHMAEGAYYDMLERVTHYEMDGENMILLSNGMLVAIMHVVAAK